MQQTRGCSRALDFCSAPVGREVDGGGGCWVWLLATDAGYGCWSGAVATATKESAEP